MRTRPLETVDLDGLLVKTNAGGLVVRGLGIGEELEHLVAVVALELDHGAVLVILNDGAVADEALLDEAKDLLEGVLLGEALDGGQGLASISLCWCVKLSVDGT